MRLPTTTREPLAGRIMRIGQGALHHMQQTRTTTQEPHQQVDKHRQREDGVQQQQLASRHG